ncbi:MAG: two-component system sensor histidine kinase NtrB [Thermodesulforhabdaceae bacterium]
MEITPIDFVRRISIQIAIRFLLGIISLTIVLTFALRGKYEPLSPLLLPLYIYALALLFFTITGGILLAYFKRQSELTKRMIFYGAIQLAFDIFSVSLFVYLSGGVVSPFPVFYVPVIIIGAFLFGLRGALLTGAFSFISYGAILVFQFYGIFQIYIPSYTTVSSDYYKGNLSFLTNLFTNLISFTITAILSGFLVEKWHVAEEHFKTTIYHLKFLRSLHENILDNIPSGVIVTNENLKIIYANKMAMQILELPPDKLLRTPITLYFNFEFDLENITSIRRKEIKYKSPLTGEEKILGYSIHHVNIVPKSQVWILLFQDLTETKRLQKELEEAERNSLVARMVANIAHNIKNPLGAIYGAGQLIEKEESASPVFKKIASIVLREAQKIDRIIQDLLRLSLVGFNPSSRQIVDPCIETKKLCQKFYEENKDKKIYNINFNTTTQVPMININPQDFEIALWNLLLNASDAMPEGGNIDISVQQNSINNSDFPYVCISVRDYGHGIPEELQEKIFQPFFTTKPRGTGLGLNIVNQIVKKYGGFIELKSREGEGAEFSIYFPAISVQDFKNTTLCPDRF